MSSRCATDYVRAALIFTGPILNVTHFSGRPWKKINIGDPRQCITNLPPTPKPIPTPLPRSDA